MHPCDLIWFSKWFILHHKECRSSNPVNMIEIFLKKFSLIPNHQTTNLIKSFINFMTIALFCQFLDNFWDNNVIKTPILGSPLITLLLTDICFLSRKSLSWQRLGECIWNMTPSQGGRHTQFGGGGALTSFSIQQQRKGYTCSCFPFIVQSSFSRVNI